VLDSPLVRVCIVQGPSGSGKTTLLRSWILQLDPGDMVAWVSLGGGVASRNAFWQHVVSSAERLGAMSAHVAGQARAQLSAAVDPVRVAREVLTGFGPVVLILDAYEHLGEVAAEIDDDLERLLACAPGLRIMITTTTGTALADATVSDGVSRVISSGELAMTVDEVQTLIAEQAGLDDGRLAGSVRAATHGFPLTVRSVVLALSQLGRIPPADSREWNTVIAAKLESLLPDQEAVGFVTDTSVPPYVDLELATALSGRDDAAGLLDMLESKGFGRWIPYASDRQVFQYVETIRDTFRARAASDLDRFSRSCVTTARWLLENEELLDQALRFAIDGGDYALADRVFVSVVISNPDSYVTDRFLPSLRKVPEAVLGTYPMLAFGLGLGLMTNPMLRLEAPRAFRIAASSPELPPYVEPAIDAFTHESMRAISRRLSGEYRGSQVASLSAARMVDGIAPALRERFGEHIGTILRQLSFSIWQGGAIDDAIATANRSVALCRRPASRNYSTVYAAAMTAFAGDTVQAAALVASVDSAAWPPEMRKTSMNGLGLLAEAYVHLDALDFDAASDVLHNSDPYMRTNEYWPLLTSAWVVTRHGLGHTLAEAERVSAVLTGSTPPPGIGDNVGTDRLHALVALAWMAGGDHRVAKRILGRGSPDSPYLAGARVSSLLASGHDAAALRMAQELIDLPGHTVRTRAETQVVGAAAAVRQGDLRQAWSWLGSAGVAWETYGARMHLAFLDPRDRLLLREFARERDSAELEQYLSVPGSTLRSSPAVPLTAREQVVLTVLAEQSSIRDLAQSLSVSPHTIKTQLQSIYRKLGVSSRQGALTVASELGMLDAGRLQA
jgi:LuxR family maltose regulon positive regulatory protein